MILAFTITNFFTILGVVVPILGSMWVFFKRAIKKIKERNDAIDKILPELIKETQSLKDVINNYCCRLDKVEAILVERETLFSDFQCQNLKYMINDTFLGHNNIYEIPTETLSYAAEFCRIYTERGYNHDTAIKCKIIWAELERRKNIQAQGGKKNE